MRGCTLQDTGSSCFGSNTADQAAKSTDLYIKLIHKKSTDLYKKLLHKKSTDLYIKLLHKNSRDLDNMADHSSLAGLDKSSGMIDLIFKTSRLLNFISAGRRAVVVSRGSRLCPALCPAAWRARVQAQTFTDRTVLLFVLQQCQLPMKLKPP